MTIKDAHKLLDMYYEKAVHLKYVFNPVAWALKQVWKWADTGRK